MKWTERLYASALVVHRKWNTTARNLQPGDVVRQLGLIHEKFPGKDERVRRVSVMYKNFSVGDKIKEYNEDKQAIVVTRSAQRLALLVPVNKDFVREKETEK